MSNDYKRLTAFKSNIKKITDSEMISEEDSPDYIKISDLRIARVRIIGTIVSKRVNSERTYAYLVVDDGTETIRIKAWKDDVDKLEKPVVGDIIELVGRVREWDDERYLTCEIIKIINNPNHWLLHKYELLLSDEKVERITEKVKTGDAREVEGKKSVEEELENKIIKIIKNSDVGRGVSMKLLTEETGKDEKNIRPVLKNLLNDGIIYEPTKHNYKFLEVE